jgi:hypothetical protein
MCVSLLYKIDLLPQFGLPLSFRCAFCCLTVERSGEEIASAAKSRTSELRLYRSSLVRQRIYMNLATGI